MFNLRCKVSHLNGVQTKLKCKPNVKRCKRFVFPVRSHLFQHNSLTTKAITFFQIDHILTRFVFPPLHSVDGFQYIAQGLVLAHQCIASGVES